jgi:hypothetical protein
MEKILPEEMTEETCGADEQDCDRGDSVKGGGARSLFSFLSAISQKIETKETT